MDYVIVLVCAIVFFFGSVFFIAVAIIADISYSAMIYCGFVIATVLLFLMYHAQTINGGRYAEMRLNDYMLAALVIYHDFVVLYVLSLFISTAIAGENKLFNIYTNKSFERCTQLSPTHVPTATPATATTKHTTTKKKKPQFRSNILLPQIYQPQSYEEYQLKYNLANIGNAQET